MNFVKLMLRLQTIVLLLAACFFILLPANAQTAAPYTNPSLPIDVRVDDLVSRMTLEEKGSQLVNQARAIPRLNVPEYDYWSEALHGVAMKVLPPFFPKPSRWAQPGMLPFFTRSLS